MVAYSFRPRFIQPILFGTKRQTIRAERHGRSRHAVTGQTMQLYTGMRTRACRLLGEAECRSASLLRMDLPRGSRTAEIMVFKPSGDLVLHVFTPRDLDAFAKADGFMNFNDPHAFWCAEHPGVDTFHGVLIRWGTLRLAAPAPEILADIEGASDGR